MTDRTEHDGHKQPEDAAAAEKDAQDTRTPTAADDGDEAPAAVVSTPDGDAPERDRRRGGRRLAVVALVIVLVVAVVAAGGGYWLWLQFESVRSLQTARIDTFSQQLQRATGRLDALRDDSGNRTETVTRLQTQVEQLRQEQQALQQRIGRLTEQSEASRDDWRRSEAAYLASVAVYRLRFYGDVDAALGALQSADALLAGYGGETIAERKAVAEAIDRLLATDTPDTAEVADRLGDLLSTLDALPLAPEPPQRAARENAAEGGEPTGSWHTRLSRAWERFKSGLSDLVVVSGERRVVPLTTREERYFLRHNLRLELETARLAALEGNAGLYRDSLQRALRWSREYLDPTRPAVAEFTRALEALSERQVATDLPDIASVLEPVRQF